MTHELRFWCFFFFLYEWFWVQQFSRTFHGPLSSTVPLIKLHYQLISLVLVIKWLRNPVFTALLLFLVYVQKVNFFLFDRNVFVAKIRFEVSTSNVENDIREMCVDRNDDKFGLVAFEEKVSFIHRESFWKDSNDKNARNLSVKWVDRKWVLSQTEMHFIVEIKKTSLNCTFLKFHHQFVCYFFLRIRKLQFHSSFSSFIKNIPLKFSSLPILQFLFSPHFFHFPLKILFDSFFFCFQFPNLDLLGRPVNNIQLIFRLTFRFHKYMKTR